MILQALYKLAEVEELIDDPDFDRKPISWVVHLRKDGSVANIEDLRTDLNAGTNRKPKYVGKSELVPFQPVRTSGDLAFFLVDKPEYVFGIDPEGERPKAKLKTRGQLFRQEVERAAEKTDDSSLRAVVRFLQMVAEDEKIVQLSEDLGPGDLIAFRVGEGGYVHLRDASRAYWKQHRAASSQGERSGLRCLVTGEAIDVLEGYPLVKRLPGGTPSGVALVSHNASAFESYGLSGNENAPVSRGAAEAAIKALNRLLDPNPLNGKGEKLPRRHIRLSGDTAIVYWSPDPNARDALDAISGLTEGDDPEAVADAYRSIWMGRPPEIQNPAAFYAMTLSGTQGRAVVRDWLEANVADVMRNLAQYFADLRIVRNTRPPKGKTLPSALGLYTLLESLAAQGKSDQVPDTLATQFVHAILAGQPYPLGVLQRALMRQRAEAGGDEWIDEVRRDARAALIKAVLMGQRRRLIDKQSLIPEIDMSFNPTIDHPGYVLGSMMGVLERLQQIAIEGANATVVDRCFSAASASPRAIMIRLLKNARHHVQKMRDDPEKGGTVFLLDRLLNEFCDHFEINRRIYPYTAEGIPPHLDLVQQGLFVLGYHQIRKWLWMTREERAEWERAHADAPRAFLWSKKDDSRVPTEPASVK